MAPHSTGAVLEMEIVVLSNRCRKSTGNSAKSESGLGRKDMGTFRHWGEVVVVGACQIARPPGLAKVCY